MDRLHDLLDFVGFAITVCFYLVAGILFFSPEIFLIACIIDKLTG